MKRLRWPPVGIVSQDDIADRETFTATNGPYSVVRSVIRYGIVDRYPPAWFAIFHDPYRCGRDHIIGRCRSRKNAEKLCNAHRECHDDGLFEKPKKRKAKR